MLTEDTPRLVNLWIYVIFTLVAFQVTWLPRLSQTGMFNTAQSDNKEKSNLKSNLAW